MKLIRASDCLTTPWKNGGGSTTEIAAEPSGASLDAFDWRISMASVAADGPFSEFPDIDRTLAVVGGKGLMLTIGGNTAVSLERGSLPISFDGEVPTSARLTEGEITDLNVMTRRRRFIHRMQRVDEPIACNFEGHDIALVLSLNGKASLASERAAVTLQHGDAAILLSRNGSLRIAPLGASDVYLVLLREA